MIPDPSSLDVFDGAEDLEHVWCEGLKPDPLLTVSEWADRYRVLSSKSASEPGRWRTARTPYLKEIMDCLSPASPVRRVVLMKGAQVGGPLAVDTPIPTPDGWKTMGTLAVGDALFDEAGRVCQVVGVSPVMTGHACFELVLDDGERVVCDGAHRWPVWDLTTMGRPVPKLLRTEEIVGHVRTEGTYGLIRATARCHLALDCCRPIGGLMRRDRHRIVAVNPVASVPVRCIEVDSASHLYLCGRGHLPSHNTETGNNWIGYVIHQAPGPMMAVSPTVELAKRSSKQRIDPLIEESEVLRSLVKERRSRDSGNTVLAKEFTGGVLVMTGANSAVGLRSMPARYLFLDEVDGYPGDVEGEGDPILLAERRSATFQRRKLLLVSTPKTKGLSRIEREFTASDQRYFFVPCPHCGSKQMLTFDRLRWPEGKPREAVYVCAHCDQEIFEHHKTDMLAGGEWRATAPGPHKAAGFHLSSLYSPVGWYSWADAAEAYEAAKKDHGLMKGFVNTVLGLPYEEEAEAPEWQRLYERREAYPIGTVPWGGLFVAAGADVHKDRIEVEIIAWGRAKESWSIDYRVLDGDTARPEVWKLLDEVLARDWPHAGGQSLPIRVLCIDSGYATQDVYAWARQYPQATWGPAGAVARQPRTVVAVKGQDRDTALLLGTSRADSGSRKRGLKVWSVGTPIAKSELYRWLKLDRPTDEVLAKGEAWPPGFCHFPQYGEEFFKQITAERLVTRMVKGFPRGVWEKDGGRRNEALDCRVYARAAAAVFGIDRFDERSWKRLEEPLGLPTVTPAPPEKKPEPARPTRRRDGSWLGDRTRNWLNRR